MKEALRIEWCKVYAGKRRWTEELALVEEEMRRVPVLLEHEAEVWEGRRQPEDENPITEGINAYGNRQAALQRAIAPKFKALWALPNPVRRSRPTVLPRIEEESDKSSEEEGGD
ncbi:hypothetical protein V5O48_010566 [Marasmius crinis-equi]|uniref:Uncharacterized protein n=1 Tax=Marasmius crinis-equi TaxID=585013 RepID=A0ABR3F826_9AGAR